MKREYFSIFGKLVNVELFNSSSTLFWVSNVKKYPQ